MDSINHSRSTWKDGNLEKFEESVDSSKLRQGKKSSYFGVDNLEQSCLIPRNIYSEAPKLV